MTLAATPQPATCLYATVVGHERKLPCEGRDTLNIAASRDMKIVLAALGIDPAQVRFRACPGDDFYVTPNENGTYVITYPANESGSLLAPLTHEAAHILQLQEAKRDPGARKVDSLVLELGADFIAGLIYAVHFSDQSLNEFQANLRLIGRYQDEGAAPHGTPAQRSSAFRRGRFLRDSVRDAAPHSANYLFQRSIYVEFVDK